VVLLKMIFNREKMRLILLLTTILLFDNQICAGHNAGEEEEWSPVSLGPVTTWTSPLCGKGRLVVQPFIFYNRTRGLFNNDNHTDALPAGDKKWQRQYQFFTQYGITDKFEIDGQTVYQENYRRQGANSARTTGLGDSCLFSRYCAIEEKGWIPHTTGVFQLKLPTGKYQKLDPNKLGTDSMGATSGGGSYDPGMGLLLTKKFKPFVLHADAIYNFPLERKVDGIKTQYGKYLNCDFGAEYFLPKGFNLMLEFNGFLQGDKRQNGSRQPATDIRSLIAAPGIGWSCQTFQTLVAYQRIIAGTNTDANDSVVFSVVYTF